MNAIQAWWSQNDDTLLIVGAASLVGLLIGLQRVALSWRASLRVHVFVAIGGALFVHIPLKFYPQSTVLSPLVQGVATGVGFLGGGAILRRPEGHGITGITVAATIWLTAALGMAVGLGSTILPIVLGAASLAFILLTSIGEHLQK